MTEYLLKSELGNFRIQVLFQNSELWNLDLNLLGRGPTCKSLLDSFHLER